jgi:predicted nucleotidyltransferase
MNVTDTRTSIYGLGQVLWPGKYRRAVLGLLFLRPEVRVHLRELARMVGAAPGPLKRELDVLSAVGLLRRERVGNQVFFSANVDHPVYPELAALLRKTVGLADVLLAALVPLAPKIHVAFVYGSLARGEGHAASDVDLMVLGEVGFAEVVEALYPAQQNLGREINPKVMTWREWQEKKSTASGFVHELLVQPKIMLIGSEHEL